MSALLVAVLVSVSSSVWIYSKLSQRTGYGNNRAALKAAAFSAVGIFIVIFTIGLMVFK